MSKAIDELFATHLMCIFFSADTSFCIEFFLDITDLMKRSLYNTLASINRWEAETL